MIHYMINKILHAMSVDLKYNARMDFLSITGVHVPLYTGTQLQSPGCVWKLWFIIEEHFVRSMNVRKF